MGGLIIERLSKTFPAPGRRRVCALESLSLELGSGQTLGVVGPSGSGKTTLLRLLAGLETPDSGDIHFSGASLNGVAPGDRDLALVFQQPALYPHLSCFENIAFGLRLRRFPAAELTRRVQETAGALGISDCLESRPDSLAGGQRQRVALSRALVRRPKLLLLDEPLSQLDGPLRAQLKRDLRSCASSFGATTVWVTHDQREALAVGDRVAVLNQGRLEQIAAPREIYSRPATVFVARFLGDPPMNLVTGLCHRQNDRVIFRPTHAEENLAWPLPNGVALKGSDQEEIALGFRPDDIGMGSAGPGTLGFEVRIQSQEYVGSAILAECRVGPVKLIAVLPSDFRAEEGQLLQVYIPADRLRLFSGASGKAL